IEGGAGLARIGGHGPPLPRGRGDLGDALDHRIAGIDVAGELDGEALGLVEALVERLVGLDRGLAQPADGAVGHVGGVDEIGDHLLQGRAIGLQALKPPVEQNAVADCYGEKNRDNGFDHEAQRKPGHGLLSIVSSMASKAAMVTFGGLSGRVTRTETLLPIWPITASVRSTPPQRRVTGSAGVTSNMMVSPLLRPSTLASGRSSSCSTASISVSTA